MLFQVLDQSTNPNLPDIFNRFLYNLMGFLPGGSSHRLIRHVQRVNVRTHPCVASLEQIVKEMGSSFCDNYFFT